MQQQIKFPGRKDRLPSIHRHFAPLRIYTQLAVHNGVGGFLLILGQELHTTEHRLDPRDQLANAEGFSDIVVRAQLQTEHPIQFR